MPVDGGVRAGPGAVTFDHDQAAAWLQRERELADRRRKRAPAAQPLGHALGDLDRKSVV